MGRLASAQQKIIKQVRVAKAFSRAMAAGRQVNGQSGK